ncbi:MAG: hypothetical protein KKA84_08140 [Bacteroidetes bacterium]|nr:hypothetical protein [Bacteroidota bacterium]
MKSIKIFMALLLFLPIMLKAQNIVIQTFINKNITDAIKNYGKPAYQDNNDPEMVMTFFKTPVRDYTFVSNSESIYQANATLKYETKEKATESLETLLKDCLSTGYKVDTLDTETFEMRSTGVTISVSASPAAGKEKYQIIIEALKRDEEEPILEDSIFEEPAEIE